MIHSNSSVLKDLLTTTKDGDWGKADPAENLVPYYIIRATDFAAVSVGDISNVPLRHLPKHTVQRRTLQPDDILIETAGGSPQRPTGRTMLVTDRVLNSFDGPVTCASFARFLRPDRDKVGPKYLYWFLQALYQTGEIEQYQVQHTGVARFQYTDFAATQQVPLPDRRSQTAIADILGALNDKIAANTKLATNATALANSKFRLLMIGAEQPATVGDIVSLEYGKSLPTTRRVAGHVDVFGSGGIVGSHNESLCDGPGVIVGRKGTAGAVHWAPGPFFPIDTTFYAEPKVEEASRIFCYFLLKTLRLDEMNSDSAVPGLNRNEALATPIKRPEAGMTREFTSHAMHLFELASQADIESKALEATRDALLPHLMSGKLRVEDVVKLVEEAV